MKTLKSEKCICPCCMEEHELQTVCVEERLTFKNVKVKYDAIYMYCSSADEYYMDEDQMRENDLHMKNAYRKAEGLLTTEEIIGIRSKYGVSQSDLCTLLGWGLKTITRYEGHQVQDKAHDSILKKVDQDPEWFLSLLKEAADNLPKESYEKYLSRATILFEEDKDLYLKKAIKASYAGFCGDESSQGNTNLSLDKVVEVIRYFATSKEITDLYKVKLMKLMWYADALSYKTRGIAITGLVYQAMPMGTTPIAYDSIIDLKDVPREEVDMGETTAYRFAEEGIGEYHVLTQDDKDTLDIVINKLGKKNKREMTALLQREQAYIKTAQKGIISYKYAESLQI